MSSAGAPPAGCLKEWQTAFLAVGLPRIKTPPVPPFYSLWSRWLCGQMRHGIRAVSRHKSATCPVGRIVFTLSAADDLMGIRRGGF